MKKLKYFFMYLPSWLIIGCGRVAYDLSSPKAAATPAAQPSEIFTVAADTLLNILNNSLLEITMVVIAIVLYLRYQAFKHQQRQLVKPQNERNYVDLKTHEGSWHFDEEEKL
jgi:hypothetical protein